MILWTYNLLRQQPNHSWRDKLHLPVYSSQGIIIVSFVSYHTTDNKSSEDNLFCSNDSIPKYKSVQFSSTDVVVRVQKEW